MIDNSILDAFEAEILDAFLEIDEDSVYFVSVCLFVRQFDLFLAIKFVRFVCLLDNLICF